MNDTVAVEFVQMETLDVSAGLTAVVLQVKPTDASFITDTLAVSLRKRRTGNCSLSLLDQAYRYDSSDAQALA